jgi:hypothetical protein
MHVLPHNLTHTVLRRRMVLPGTKIHCQSIYGDDSIVSNH